jgi:hypothetical protein
MPRIPIILAALLVFAAIAGIGGWFLLRPPEIKRPAVAEETPAEQPPPGGAPPEQIAARPKLAVLVVFDQMRGDYLSRWADLYQFGFQKIKKEGIWFSACQVPYACTATGPGHASLATGATPSVHGIVENEWYDRKRKPPAMTYCCEPTRLYDLVPPLAADAGKPERGSALGYSPENLLAPTVGDALHAATNGKARVFSLSIKDRTAVLMGGHHPTGVYCFDTRDGRFHTGAYYGREAEHPWVRAFNNSKLANFWFNTEWTRLRPEADYIKFCGPDDAPGEAVGFNGQGHVFPHSLKGKLEAPARKYYEALEGSPFGNEMLFALAKQAVTAESLGKGEVPDLLCLSFSANDLLGHRWGPDSHEVMDITLRSDKLVGDLLMFLDAQVGKDRYVLVVAADHGVCPLPELPGTKAKYPAARRVMLEKTATAPGLVAELEAALNSVYAGEPMHWFDAFDTDTWPWVYLNYKAIQARKLKVEDVAVFVRDWFAGRDYMETAFTRQDLEDRSAPANEPFRSAARMAYRPERCGDVIAIPKAGVLVTKYAQGTNHGTPQPYDAHIPFLVYGAGVPPLGERTEKVSSLSIAPTLAWALGIPPPRDAAVLPPEAIPVRK